MHYATQLRWHCCSVGLFPTDRCAPPDHDACGFVPDADSCVPYPPGTLLFRHNPATGDCEEFALDCSNNPNLFGSLVDCQTACAGYEGSGGEGGTAGEGPN